MGAETKRFADERVADEQRRAARFAWVGAAVLLSPLASCNLVRVRVVVVNSGTTPLTNVRVIVSETVDDLGTLAPGQRASVSVRARGESGITISYRASGRVVDSGSMGYLEPGYSGTVTLTVDETGVRDADWRINTF